MYNYQKFKERSPEETVRNLQGILNNIGLIPSVEWTETEYEGAYSNRVSLYPTSIGSNGKGTDALYAMASGFAELMERMENGMLAIMHQSIELEQGYGFVRSPDERAISVEEIAEQNDIVTNYLFNKCNRRSFEEKVDLLKELAFFTNGRMDGKIICIPFADYHENRVIYLPMESLFYFYGSNGMASGNTMEEALVQGLSEIFERYVNKAVICGVVPPEIPREYINKFQISELIRDIEKDRRYKVSLLDCSLGRGIPACAIVIHNLKKGTFGVKFACHPSFQISVERTLTEAFQGKKLEVFSGMSSIGSDSVCVSNDNIPNVVKVGLGAYPVSLFAGKPSYEFQPTTEWDGMTNQEMLVKMLRLVKQEGFRAVIRDASHLGFPAYQIIIPGMSEIYEIKDLRFKEMRTGCHLLEHMRRFPNLTPEEENRLMLMIRFKEYSALENGFSWLSMLPVKGKELEVNRIRALLHFKRGEYSEAFLVYRNLSNQESDEIRKANYLCASEYARLKSINVALEDIATTIHKLFRADIANYVVDVMSDPDNAMAKVFYPLPCDDCKNCKYAEWECQYPQSERVMMKIKTALSKSTVSQETFLRQLDFLQA